VRIANSNDHSRNPAGCLLSWHADFRDGLGQVFQLSNDLKMTWANSKMAFCVIYPPALRSTQKTERATRGHKTSRRPILRAENLKLGAI